MFADVMEQKRKQYEERNALKSVETVIAGHDEILRRLKAGEVCLTWHFDTFSCDDCVRVRETEGPPREGGFSIMPLLPSADLSRTESESFSVAHAYHPGRLTCLVNRKIVAIATTASRRRKA